MPSNKTPDFKDLILYEDDHLIVIDKPSGMSSLEDKESLHVQALAQEADPELRLCHRLDKHTSGCLILAKDAEAYRDISLQFQHRTVSKHYTTLVAGVHHFDQLEIDIPLLVTTNKKVFVSKSDGKPATTIVSTLQQFRRHTVLDCQPVTGRMHQIRVHLAAQKCPIIGDELYGGQNLMLSTIKKKYKFSGRKEEQPLNHGFLLHAASITFHSPGQETPLTVDAPLPKNFEVVLRQLEKHDQQ